MADTSAAAEHLALALTQSGMQRMSARVWSVIMCADKESVTAGEIAEQLGVSAGAVSGAVKTLLTGSLIVRVPAPGSRREHYAFPPGAWAKLFSQRDHLLQAILAAAQEAVEVTGENSIAGQRLTEMRDFLDYFVEEMPAVLNRWEEEREVRRKQAREV